MHSDYDPYPYYIEKNANLHYVKMGYSNPNQYSVFIKYVTYLFASFFFQAVNNNENIFSNNNINSEEEDMRLLPWPHEEAASFKQILLQVLIAVLPIVALLTEGTIP